MKWFKLSHLLLIVFIIFSQPNQSIADNITERVLIMFNEPDYYSNSDGNIQKMDNRQVQKNDQLITNRGGIILERISLLKTVVADIPTNQLDELANNPAIKFIEKDHLVSIQKQFKEPESNASKQSFFGALAFPTTNWTDWGTEKINAPQAWQQELTGQGVKVAVMDTGIASHPDLQIKKGVSFTDYTDLYADDNGHGTHVAGIIAAGYHPDGLRGVAPEVELYAIKVLDKEGQGYHSTIIKGVEWAIEQNIDIINISIGGTNSSKLLEAALNKANDEHGIIIVAAAGNNGNLEANGNTIEFPARYQSVIAVGATDTTDSRGKFSAHGDELELVAPGIRIKSTYLNNSYQTRDGTSMAAPHVTGLLALLKQAQPSLSNEQLRLQIRDYTKDLGDQGKDTQYGFGRIEFPTQFEINLPPTEPENVTLEKKNNAEITLSWSHPTETSFNIYRNGEKIQTVNDEFFFTEQLLAGTYTYQLTAINQHELESNKTASLEITIAKTISDTAAKYSDVKETDWFMPSLHHLQLKNIIEGYPDGTFRPQQQVTRAELVVMLGRVLQLNSDQRNTNFPDVNVSFYASGYIQSAFERELITGYSDGRFRPQQTVTREEAAVILARAFPLKKQATTVFPDVDPNHYSYQSIQLVLGEEIALGYPDGHFKPKQGVTRAELVTFLSRSITKFQ